MFLPLAPWIALGRALGAAGVVATSMAGHASMGHHHLDLARAALGFVLLLGTVWRTDDPRMLLIGSLATQVLVHGGIPSEAHMLSLHLIGALAALLLTRHLELGWRVLRRLLAPLFVAIALAVAPAPVPAARTSGRFRLVVLRDRFRSSTPWRRGPPVLA